MQRQQKNFVVYLNEQDDCWHRILGENRQKFADKLSDFALHSNWNLAYIVFVAVLAIICRFIVPEYQYIPAFLGLLWMITTLFTFNVSMTKRMLKSFVFWFKMYNWMVAIICYILLFNVIWYIEGFNWITGTLIMAAVSLHDGWRINKKSKIIVGIICWLFVLGIYGFIYFEGDPLLFGGEYAFKDRKLTIMGESLSVKSNCLNALFSLLLFMGEQLFTMIRYKNKASVLSSRPSIIWVENWDEMNHEILNNREVNVVDLSQDI